MQLLTNINITGPFSHPNKLWISNVNHFPRELTFSWSPVAPDCPAIHYNILASNCGSCPTTINHTTVTCADVPTNNSVCTFAVQTVVDLCGNITGNVSDPIRVNTNILYPIINQNMHTSTVYIVLLSSLATALIASVAVMIIILTWSKAKIKAALEGSNRAEGITYKESLYDDVTGPLPSFSAVDTQDNVAYGHTKTSTLK